MGRPLLLDDLAAKRIVDALTRGASRTAAARAAGVSLSTLMNWQRRGEDGEPGFVEFVQRIQKADGRAVQEVETALFEKAKEGNVPAMQLFLQARCPEVYGKRFEAANDAPVASEAEGNDEATLESLLAAVRSRKAG